ncbi:MAG: pitrilysin family protein [FCB group bacterium]|jgi:predicted Zn-dependent peptidase
MKIGSKLNNVILFFLILLFTPIIFNSQTAYSQFNPIKFVRDSLPNGLEIIYNIDKSAPIVATVMHYRVGSKDEIPGKTGYAHFFEHLMFEATKDIPRATIDKYVQEAGGTLNAHTSWDETVFFFKLPANQIKLALWIESERMRKLKIDSIGVETQRGVVIEELKMRTDNQPYGSLIQKMCENLFPGTSYGWAAIGFIADIKKAAISDFRQFYDNFYQPNNCTLVISGDIDVDSVKQYVRDYFGIYPKGKDPVRNNFDLKPLEKAYSEKIEDPKAQLPALFIGFRGTKLNDQDYYALSLLTKILANGESSRLYQRLVDKEQVAVQSTVIPLSLQYAGAILLIGVCAPEKSLKELQEVALDEINNVIKNGISDEELTKAKNITEAEFVADKKSVLSKAQTLATYNSYYHDPGLINSEIEKYNKIKIDDLMRVAKKYFGTDKMVVLTYVPPGYKE